MRTTLLRLPLAAAAAAAAQQQWPAALQTLQSAASAVTERETNATTTAKKLGDEINKQIPQCWLERADVGALCGSASTAADCQGAELSLLSNSSPHRSACGPLIVVGGGGGSGGQIQTAAICHLPSVWRPMQAPGSLAGGGLATVAPNAC